MCRLSFPERLLYPDNGPLPHAFETPQGNSNLAGLAGAFQVPLDQGGLNLDDFCSNEPQLELSNVDNGALHNQLYNDFLSFVSERDGQVVGVLQHVGDPPSDVGARSIQGSPSDSDSQTSHVGRPPLVNQETGLLVSSFNDEGTSVLIGDPSLYNPSLQTKHQDSNVS